MVFPDSKTLHILLNCSQHMSWKFAEVVSADPLDSLLSVLFPGGLKHHVLC